jgi:disulfide bond formation protein DsbB
MNMIQPGQEKTARNDASWYLVFVCWLIAAVSLLGSLFLDQALGYEPCTMCWYQRIFMYPLVPVLLVGLFPLDRSVVRYALPLALLGWATAFYHLLLQAGVISERLQPCDESGSCAEIDLILFGFMTIPLLSLLAFTAVVALLVIFLKRTKV